MAKELDPQSLIESFEQDADKSRDRVAELDIREKELTERLSTMEKAFEERTAKTRARLAAVQAKKAAEQAKVDGLAQKIEWARSMPVASNAPVVTADQEFGDASTDVRADDEGAADGDGAYDDETGGTENA